MDNFNPYPVEQNVTDCRQAIHYVVYRLPLIAAILFHWIRIKVVQQLTCITLGCPSGPAYSTGELLNTPLVAMLLQPFPAVLGALLRVASGAYSLMADVYMDVCRMSVCRRTFFKSLLLQFFSSSHETSHTFCVMCQYAHNCGTDFRNCL